jgi:hypothetical protein
MRDPKRGENAVDLLRTERDAWIEQAAKMEADRDDLRRQIEGLPTCQMYEDLRAALEGLVRAVEEDASGGMALLTAVNVARRELEGRLGLDPKRTA